ncbi:MAG: hypothetical protein EOM18_13235 [Clostridia bacterium]|nr:hypothetical protein [Clostridia bacterium]
MESLEENDGFCQDTLHIRLRGEDNWSGIKRISLMKNGSVLLEERMNQRPGEVIQWERIITIPAEDNEKITLQAELEDMAGHVTRVSDSWMCDIQAPYVSARFEDEKGKIESTENGYLKNTGNLILYVEEIWFRPELWDISWIEHPGRKPDISWTRNENTYMCVIPIYEEGNYELQISGGDLAGNIMQTAYGEGQWNLQWILDITSPEITIQGVKNAEQYNGDIQMKIAIKDTGLNNEKLSCRLVGAGKGEIQIYEESNQDRNTDPKTKIFLWNPPKNEDWDDTYHLVVEAYDQAGNQNIKNMDFVVNRRGSKYLVSGMEKGTVFSSYPHINISEENLSQVIDHRILYTWEGESRILENGKDYRISEKTEGNYMKYTYHLKETLFLRDGNYTFVVLSEDAAGNKGSSLKNKVASMPIRFSVDRTSPSVIVNLDNPQGDDDNKGASVRILENQTLKNIKIWKDDEKIPVLINNEDYENILLEDERLKGWDKLKIEVEDEAGNIWVENIENSQKKSGEKTNEKPAEVKLMEEKNSTQKDVIIGWILSLAGVGGGIVKKIKKIKK